MNLFSPDNTTDGNLKKKWKISAGKRVLIKGGSNPFRQEVYNEVIASLIAEKLGIDHAILRPYRRIWWCLLFKKKAYQSYFCSTIDKSFLFVRLLKIIFPDGNFNVVHTPFLCVCFSVWFLVYIMYQPILRGVLWSVLKFRIGIYIDLKSIIKIHKMQGTRRCLISVNLKTIFMQNCWYEKSLIYKNVDKCDLLC